MRQGTKEVIHRERGKNDARYREQQARVDDLTKAVPLTTVDTVKESIRDMYKIYGKGMTIQDFAKWYAMRYGIRIPAVLAVVQEMDKGEG